MSATALHWAAPFEALRIGDAFASPPRTLTEADVLAFAQLTGDDHPQHVDAAWAAASPFGAQIAHGMLVVSAAVGLVGFDPERVVALRGLRDVVFKRPVHLGESISVEGAIEALRPAGADAGLVTFAWRVLVGAGTAEAVEFGTPSGLNSTATGTQRRLSCRALVDVVWRRGETA